MQPHFSARRIAVIDIGTVTCRMLVADVDVSGTIEERTREYAIANLGEGVDATGRLKPEAIERVATIVEHYLDILNGLEGASVCPAHIVALTTSASRDAQNADEFEARLRELGVSLRVISGDEEAALSFAGATLEFPGEEVVVVDVGGGSTEVIAGSAGEAPVFAHSFNVGCRRVTERFLHADPMDPQEIAAARAWIASQFAAEFEKLRSVIGASGSLPRMVAVAGTATSVVSIREKMAVYDRSRVHKSVVSRAQLKSITAELASLSLEQRKMVVGLDPKRAPVIVAGLLVLEEVMDQLGADLFTVSESDILQGMVLRAARE